MARLLKVSTAFTFRIGPFLDATDGVTAETALSIAQADIQISKNGGAFAQTSASPTTTHDADGWYQCPLTSTDTNTLGPLTVQIAMSGALPVWEHFMVVPANVYDSLVGGSDNLQVDTTQFAGQTITASGGVTIPAATLASTTNITAGTITTATNVTTVNGLAGNVITAASVAASALNGKGDWNVGKTGYSLSQSFPANFADLAITAATGRVTVGTNADKAGYSISGAKTTLDALNDLSAAQANAEADAAIADAALATAAALATVDAVADAIKVKTDTLPASPAATSDIPTATQNADALLDRAAGVETGVTPRQGFRLMLAALAGKLSGAATTTITVRDTNDTTDRIVATVDAAGNRSALTLNPD